MERKRNFKKLKINHYPMAQESPLWLVIHKNQNQHLQEILVPQCSWQHHSQEASCGNYLNVCQQMSG